MESSIPRFVGKLRLVGPLLAALLFMPPAFAAGPAFSPQTRLGFRQGDQWEPAIATDGYGHVYVLYPQYPSSPECFDCPSPGMILVLSRDNGATWQPPHPIAPPGSGQFDPQIVVDPTDRRTVYAAWLENRKSDIVLAKSVDFGQSWSIVIADRTHTETDKPVLAVRGQDVYIGFSHWERLSVAASHDGGITFTSSLVNARLGWSQAGGATVDSGGNVYFAWAGYSRAAANRGAAGLYISKSSDGGRTWNSALLDVSAAPPDCSALRCGWAFLGAQIAMTSDEAGTLYALWNAGRFASAPERIYFASSTTAAATWSPKANVSTATAGVEHAFPAIVAGSAGDVRIAWMDSRKRPLWNTFYRSSTNGGATWSAETKLSSYAPKFSYIRPDGFSFPFGDYFGLAIDSRGQTQAVWGEGLDYVSPGSIWYTSGR